MKVIVCGGRDYTNRENVHATLDALFADPNSEFGMPLDGLHILNGGAKGADALADQWAVIRWVNATIFQADWERYGRAAGPIRNTAMLDYGAELVVAFPGGAGTEDMVRQARSRGVMVIRVHDDGERVLAP